jgi:hypothetical protein
MKSKFLFGVLCLALFSRNTYAQTKNADSQIKQTTRMKEFMLLLRVPTTYGSEQAKAVGPKWDIVLAKWKADNIFVISFVFPGESFVVSGADRQVKNESVVVDNLRVVTGIILRAESLENAVALAKVCPVLDYGGTIEVREIPPRPVSTGN